MFLNRILTLIFRFDKGKTSLRIQFSTTHTSHIGLALQTRKEVEEFNTPELPLFQTTTVQLIAKSQNLTLYLNGTKFNEFKTKGERESHRKGAIYYYSSDPWHYPTYAHLANLALTKI